MAIMSRTGVVQVITDVIVFIAGIQQKSIAVRSLYISGFKTIKIRIRYTCTRNMIFSWRKHNAMLIVCYVFSGDICFAVFLQQIDSHTALHAGFFLWWPEPDVSIQRGINLHYHGHHFVDSAPYRHSNSFSFIVFTFHS